jgi:hypothetical protein
MEKSNEKHNDNFNNILFDVEKINKNIMEYNLKVQESNQISYKSLFRLFDF